NSIDNLGGNDDLISLRSRGEYSRPFVVVQQIRRDAEAQFRDQERALQAKLKEAEAKMQQLQAQRGEGGDYMLSQEQKNEINSFHKERLKTRKELRAVQHDLRKNIEKLGSMLKFINIGLIPILISIFAVGISIYRFRHQSTN
ncbi:MAG: ABC transporter, partial [Gammaproteobacteria bacterium]